MNKFENSGSGRKIWIIIPFFLVIFSFTTPYDFSWPSDVKHKKNFIQVNEAIYRMERGNLGRRIGLVVLAFYAAGLLAVTRNRFRINGAAGWLLIIYFAWVLMSLLWSIDKMFTLRRVTVFAILWFAAIATAAHYSIKDLARIAFWITGVTAAAGFVNEIRLHTLDPFYELWRFSGVFHTVMMGWNCGLLTLSAAYLAYSSKDAKKRYWYFAALLFGLVLLVLTKSRMALASTIVGLFFFGTWVSTARARVAAVLLMLIAISISYLAMGDGISSLGDLALTLGRGETAKESIGTLTGRLPLWNECFRWAAKRPILGYGFNTFISPKHYVEISQNVGWIPSSIHSGYLDALMGLGVIGLFGMLAFLSAALIRVLTLARENSTYVFVASVLIWFSYNIFLEANLYLLPTFMTFVVLTFLARLAFLPAAEQEVST